MLYTASAPLFVALFSPSSLVGKALIPIVSQVYEGDITIRPPFRVLDLIELLSNPTDEKFRRCVRIMERKTWPLLTKIRNQISIECVLDDCIRRIKK